MHKKKLNNLIITALVSFSVIPILVVGLLSLKDARELGNTAIVDATEMGMTAVQQSREALTDMAAQQLHAHAVTLSQRLNESIDTRSNDIIALSHETIDENIYRRFVELHMGIVHDPADVRSSDVEPYPDKTQMLPVYKSVYVISPEGEIVVGLDEFDDGTNTFRIVKKGASVSGLFPQGNISNNTMLQIYNRIVTGPNKFRDKILTASVNAEAIDDARNSNLLVETLDHSDNVKRLTDARIRCGTPIFHNNDFAGVLVVDIDWLHIMKLVNDFKFGKFGYAYLQEITGETRDLKQDSPDLSMSNVLPDGRTIENGEYLKHVNMALIIAHPQHNYVGWMDFTALGIPNLTNLSSLQNSLLSGVYKYMYDNKPHLTVYTPVTFRSNKLSYMNNWSVAATIPVYEIIMPAIKNEEQIKSKIDLATAKIKTRTESLGSENAFILTTILVAAISFVIALMVSKQLQSQARLELENATLEANNTQLEQSVHDREAAEKVARSERDKAQQYLDVAGVVLLALNNEGCVQMINRKGIEVLGYPEAYIRGRDWVENFIPEQNRATIRGFFQQMMEGKVQRNHTESRIITSTGEEKIISWVNIVLHDGAGQITGTLSSGEDITDKKKVELEKQIMEQKAMVTSRLATVGEMASGIAHEINNPLTAVIGFSELLVQRDIPAELKSDIKIIHEGASRVSLIISRLLAFARQQKPRRDFVNINDVITTTIDLRKYHLKTDNIEIVTHLDPQLKVTLADAGQIQQVFLNLILNAEHAMTEFHGEGTLTVQSSCAGPMLRFSVKDDGPGIPEDVLPKIFDPFFTTKDVGKGTGLGLSICHGIISEHNGRIYTNSQMGAGTEFIIELPVVTNEPEQKVKDIRLAVSHGIGGNILIVDDEPHVRQYLANLLTNNGFLSHNAPDAATALTLLKTNKFDVFLLDYKMPGMTGIELLGQIKQIDKRAVYKTILLTGDVMNVDIQDFIKSNELLVLTKPLSSEELVAAVQRIVIEGKSDIMAAIESGHINKNS